MRDSIYLLLVSFVLLGNRCAPEVGVLAYEGVGFEIENNSSNAILVLSKVEINDYKKGFISPEKVTERFVSPSAVKYMFFTDAELGSSSEENNYVLAVVEEKKIKNKKVLKLKRVFIEKRKLIENSKNKLLVYTENRETKITFRVEKLK